MLFCVPVLDLMLIRSLNKGERNNQPIWNMKRRDRSARCPYLQQPHTAALTPFLGTACAQTPYSPCTVPKGHLPFSLWLLSWSLATKKGRKAHPQESFQRLTMRGQLPFSRATLIPALGG